jgi:tRNA(fMet)-specific endonuclease VapC
VKRILLDTSAYSAFMRNHGGIIEKIQRAARICVTPVVLGELHSGFLRGSRLEENRRLLAEFLASARVETLVIDEETSLRYAEILDSLREAGTPIPTNDVWLAASAMQHGLWVLTTDAHYEKIAQIGAVVLAPMR